MLDVDDDAKYMREYVEEKMFLIGLGCRLR